MSGIKTQQSATNAYYVSRYVQSNNKNNGNNYAPVCAYAILIKVMTTGGWHHPPSSRFNTKA